MLQENGLSEWQESCRQEVEELRRVQEERMQLSIRENEEKMQRFERKYEEKRQRLRRENEESLARLQEQNEAQLALMVAKHLEEEERATKKAEQLETEMEVSNNQPAVPQCPVRVSSLFNLAHVHTMHSDGFSFMMYLIVQDAHEKKEYPPKN